MPSIDTVRELVYAAVDDVNAIMAEPHRLTKSPESLIVGAGTVLESIGLVNLIVAVEDRVHAEFAVTLTLADDILQPGTGIQTLGALTIHVQRCIEDRI